ncbi:CfrBI family restriction endonuclease, partial [Flavobacterium soyangense]
MSTFTTVSLKNVLNKLYEGEDYRGEVISLIQDNFIAYSLDFLKRVMLAKIENKDITVDWYEKEFIQNEDLKKDEIAINSGMNMKTISNKYKTTKKDIVISASNDQYDDLKRAIDELIDVEKDLDLTLTIKYNKASVDLTLNETLIVINTLAVKRAAIRAGAWSSIGKNIEKPLMKSLCILYGVPEKNYEIIYKKADYSKNEDIYSREIDFYLVDNTEKSLLCEVKLMGKGNPEVADAVIARKTNLFVADTLSETNKRQLKDWNIEWIELRAKKGYEKVKDVLKSLN